MKKINILLSLAFMLLVSGIVSGQTTSTVTDNEGITYKTVTIGSQEWMAENLRVTRYNNGDDIVTGKDLSQWQVADEGFWTYFDNNTENDEKYGKLYNWYAVNDVRGVCPDGWRVPTDNDWQILVEHIDSKSWGNNNSAGTKLKSKRQVNSPLGGEFNTSEHPRWDSHTKRYGTDNYLFNALPGGYFSMGNSFSQMGQWAYFWSATEAPNSQIWARTLLFSHRGISRSTYPKEAGLSIRCVKGTSAILQVPQIETHAATNIATTSAVLTGKATAIGSSAISQRGFVIGTSENPTIANNLTILVSGSGMGIFSETVTILAPSNKYWIRAYATNDNGTAYGTQKQIITPSFIELPNVSTTQITNTTAISAETGGFISSIGGDPVVQRGMVWSTYEDPTTDDNEGITIEGAGEGKFTSKLTNLTPETTYYVRAYATNAAGTAYGDNEIFETVESSSFTLTLTTNNPNWGTTQGEGSYEAGVEVNVNATPETDYEFVNWTNELDIVSTDASFTYTMPAENVTLTANFKEVAAPTYTLSLEVTPTSTGTVTGNGEYEEGEEVNVTATPATGYEFVNWTNGLDIVSTDASFTYTMPAEDVTLTANFEIIVVPTYTLTLAENPASTGTVTGNGNYEAGETITITATPATGYEFINWTNGLDIVSTDASYTYTMPAESVTLTANFEVIVVPTYTLTLAVNPASTGTVTGNGSYEAGETITITATPATGYEFVNWTNGLDIVSTDASYTYIMPVENATLTANFEAIVVPTYTLTLAVNPASTGTVTGNGNYEAGETITITATPATGYEFINWTNGLDIVSTNASYTYIMPVENVTLTANFEAQNTGNDGEPCPDAPVATDYDGNTYNTILMGSQCWFGKNLRTTHYSNGDAITKDTDWAGATSGVYGVYPHSNIDGFSTDEEVLNAYGALYNWYSTADARNICPDGWRVATNDDWSQLTNYIATKNNVDIGKQLKSCRQLDHPNGGACNTNEHPRWDYNATNYGTDDFNFSALPSGFRDENGAFYQVGIISFWWTSTENDAAKAHDREMKNSTNDIKAQKTLKKFGLSVRCVKE